MRSLQAVFAALAVLLGIVCGNLWYELRSARQVIAALQSQSIAPIASEALPTQSLASQMLNPQLGGPAAAATPSPVITASVSQPLATGTAKERLADALQKSDRTAAARVQAWNAILQLNSEQLQSLNDIAAAELRRETEESLEIDSKIGPLDPVKAAQVKVETVSRQHETNLRILERIKPQLTSQQSGALQGMFEGWAAQQMMLARAALRQAQAAGK